jgi:hypothetical protein
MSTPKLYIVWDFWSDEKTCYAIYEKEGENKLYFSEATKEEQKLLIQKIKQNNSFLGRIKRLFRRKK